MAAKKPLLPPGSRWKTLERSSELEKDEKPQNNGEEVTDKVISKLFTSVSTDRLTSLCETNFHRRPPRSSSDDLLSHDRGIPRKPLPPTPPLNRKGNGTNVDATKCSIAQRSPTNFEKPPRSNLGDLPNRGREIPRKPLPPTPPLNSKVYRTNMDSTKCNIAQHSPTTFEKPPRASLDCLSSRSKDIPRKPLPPTPPLNSKVDGIKMVSSISQCSPTNIEQPPPSPHKAKNNVQSPDKSPKPPVVPRKTYSKADSEGTSMDKKSKPPIPRKPHTVYATNKTGTAYPRKLCGSKPIEPPGLFQKTDICKPLPDLNRGKVKIPLNEGNTTKLSLEKMLLTKSIEVSTGASTKDISINDRPTSMILTSQITLDEEDFAPFSTIPRAKQSRDSKKLAMTTSHDKVNKRKGLFHKLKKVLQLNENASESVSSSSSEEEEEVVNGENEEDMDNKGGTIKFRPKLRHVSDKETQRKRASMIDSADPSNEYRHLFEFVMVVGLRKVETNGKYEPHVTYRFPPASQMELSKDQAVQEIPNFCFPDINTIKPMTNYSSETFSFVLTDVDGNRRFGYCRRLLPSGNGPRLPEVYCLVSDMGCFSMYEKILDHLEERRKASPSAAFTLLKAILANPFPAPGKSVEVSAFSVKGDGMQVIKFTRPLDSRLEHVDFSILFSCLDIKHIIQLFSAMLMERRIIFCAEKLSTFSSCCHAATSLLYPCDWQHIFIPVLPNKLIDFCCSPLPYILGILPQNVPLLQDMDIEEVYIIHLDNGKVLNKMGDESMILPAKAKAYLEDHLVAVMEQWEQQGTLDSAAVADTFLTFFAYILGNYSQFMDVKDSASNEKSFKTEKYIKSFSSEAVRRFLDAFQNTQMFDVFVQQRETPAMYSSIANGYFEKNLTRLKERSKDIDMMSTGHSLAAKWKKFMAKRFKSS